MLLCDYDHMLDKSSYDICFFSVKLSQLFPQKKDAHNERL